MKFDETDTELLKAWTIKKLEHVSDADADVLADYVLALVTTDEPEPVARANCTENLKDFLGEKADAFVNELFTAITTKSYDPLRPPPRPARPTYQPPRRAGVDPPQTVNQGKKRGYHDWDRDEEQGQYNSLDRPVKHARRGCRGGRSGSGSGSGRTVYPQPPMPPPGVPPFDPANPMASFLAMAAAMGMLPPSLPTPPVPLQREFGNRCRDFDTKGFCTRGTKCSYEHGNDAYVVPEVDGLVDPSPVNELLAGTVPTSAGVMSYPPVARPGQRQQKSPAFKRGRGRSRRADVSLQGPSQDQSITTIVVEQIPEEKFEEQIVRDFFSEFGTIEELTMMHYKRLAIIKYDSYRSANAAYNSPKSVFDNRFVKVYWYKSPDSLPQQLQHGNSEDFGMQEQEPEIDIEEVRQRQEEAQRRHEEKQKLIEEARQNRKDIENKLKELEVKKRELADELARKLGKPAESGIAKHVREQLAKLEEEARTLGIDPDAVTGDTEWSNPPYYSRGRGGYSGRGRGRVRGRVGYRSGWAGAARGGAVKRLDNRPKTVLVSFTEGSYDEHQEALRSWLLFNSAENSSLDKHPDQDSALVTFEERYQGEIFMAATCTTDFPLHGKVELSWYAGAPVTNGLQEVKHEEPARIAEAQHEELPSTTEDYDVAHEDDRWG